jgi:hypothetical protein
MINLLLFISAATGTPSPLSPNQMAAIQPYLDCFQPMVAENYDRDEKDYIRFDDLFAQVKRKCAAQRLTARDALAAHVAAQVLRIEGRQMPDGDAWKEDLIDEATIKWMGRGFGSGSAR